MRGLNRSLVAAVAAALALAAGGPAAADDRDLLKDSFGEPYVFIVFDTSGSMHWSTQCTAEIAADPTKDLDVTDGGCTLECVGAFCPSFCPNFGCVEFEKDEDGNLLPNATSPNCVRTGFRCVQPICGDQDCFTALNGDDPRSKFYQAKSALYEVLTRVEGVNFGFATYNQDDLHLRAKHWLYEAAEAGVQVTGWGRYPQVGFEEVFGFQWNCDSGNSDDEEAGCYGDEPADVSDAYDLARVQRLPKGGLSFNQDRTFFVRHSGTRYAIRYRPDAGTLGDPTITVEVDLFRCDNGSCSNTTHLEEVFVDFNRVSDFNSWDIGADRTAPGNGFFSQGQASDSPAGNTCAGWDPNDDTTSDRHDGYSTRWPTTLHPNVDFRPHMNEGDVIPLSWQADNKQAVLRRLAPNIALGEAEPDFRTARYFEHTRDPGDDFLELLDEGARPMAAFGSTPLGFSLADFRTWWAGCEQGSCSGDTGWSDLAAANDPDWACRKKYLLVITDGDDTCPGRDPCSFTASLFAQEAVKTYVVGFGVQNTPGNRLTCMASNGGTGEPIFADDRQELVAALRDIFGEIQEEARAFASAAVPSVQAEVADKIYLSSFTPLNNESVWDGHIDAFLKPLEACLTLDNRPDRNNPECHLWDAGAAMLVQVPDQADVDADDLKLGPAADQRRVYFARSDLSANEPVPRPSAVFRTPDDSGTGLVAETSPPTAQLQWKDLFDGLGLIYTFPDDADDDDTPPKVATQLTVDSTLVLKESTIEDADGNSTDVEYVLGDIFHSNPVVVDRPADFRAFAGNYYSDGSDAGGVCNDDNPGYRCFAQEHQRRRKMLAVGANDGMLHLFDAGVFVPESGDPSTGLYTNGTGKELMAFIPRLTLPIVRNLAQGASQVFAVDGTPRVVDVFIDPVHDATTPPSAAEREWRTVMVTGLREGGSRDAGGRVQLDNGLPFTSGYFALDLTQPDDYDGNGVPRRTGEDSEGNDSVPNCLVDASADCGTVRFGSELWEFTDSVDGSPAEWGIALDEDDNDFHDLGDTWSVPVIGRIRVGDPLDPEDRFVAIFGGGFDPESRANPRRGTWLYMVDVETGKAIYKRPLEGAAPSTPAAVDRNRDGYIDWIYIGTTAGFLYKVDVSVPAPLADFDAPLLGPGEETVPRVTDVAWAPFKIFSTGARPIFFPPTVLNVAEIGRFVLAFGTGDREQLWTFDGNEGRFYMIVDEGFTRAQALAGTLPKTEAAYNVFDSESATNQGADLVLNPPNGRDRGWVLTLDPDERMVAQAFSVSGVTIFPTFKPQITIIEQEDEEGREDTAVCARTGDSRVFVMFSHNGDPILPSEIGGATPDTRYMTVGEALVTPPFADQSATKNPSEGQTDPTKEAWREAIKNTLSQLFPPGTRFANYTIDVSFIRSDTGLVGPIPIPIGIVEKNWKQF